MGAKLIISGPGGNAEQGFLARRTVKPSDETADLRDSLGVLVGGNYTGFTDDDSKGAFKRMVDILGQRKAQDLAAHVFIQNTKPELKAMNPLQRVTTFYGIRSSKPETDDTLQRIKSFGTGVRPGFTDSSNSAVRALQGEKYGKPIIDPGVENQLAVGIKKIMQ